MLPYKKISAIAIPLLAMMVGCTKLDESLKSTLTQEQAKNALGVNGTQLLLNAAYVDLAAPFTNQDQVFSLEENASDESLVPTRGGDWDDNGVWRVIHNHTWNADHAQVLSVFNSLNKLNFDATNVLTFSPTAQQIAEARFLRAYALYYLLDLYGQYPLRNPGDNLLNAPTVLSGAPAVNFIISELTAALPDLKPSTSASSTKSIATQDAAKALLMHVYLQRGAFLNRASPTFASSDLDSVIYYGNQIMTSGNYSYAANFFDNFNATNGNSPELIWGYANTSGNPVNNAGVDARWMMTLHYNSYSAQAPNAGWNGFSTISDFYNTFGVNAAGPVATTYSMADSSLDSRIGLRAYGATTANSGIRPGMLVGQQYDAAGNPENDRKGNLLAFTPTIASNMIETGNNLEVTGIRVVKYVPDFTDASGKYYSSNSGNWLVFMRYPDVVLMVAEAQMRKGNNAAALALVNQLRAARNAPALTSMTLVNPANVDDPTTLLAERGRELYWESFRRTDLIRFGVFLTPWQYKPNDDPKNLVYPIPTQALASNPNLTQNPGY
jgi:hypothetical protein